MRIFHFRVPTASARGVLAMLFIAALSAAACGGAGKPQFPHLQAPSGGGGGDTRTLTLPDDVGTMAALLARFPAEPLDDPVIAGDATYIFGSVTNFFSLQYASFSLWEDPTSFAFRPAYFTDNAVLPPPPTANAGGATYNAEGGFYYRGASFYPEGEFTADFNAATISGRLWILDATDTDFFGARTEYIKRSSGITLTFSNGEITAGGAFRGDVSANAADGGGARLPNADGVTGGSFEGAFYDAADYNPATATPAELAGSFELIDRDGEKLEGGFAAKKE